MLVKVIKYFQVQGLKLMGKQINYYMEYDSFILLAKKAIELGCEIFHFSDEHLKRGYSPDIISKDNRSYCFHIPEADDIETEQHRGEFCFVAEDGNGQIIGVITGRAYYNEVHIGDLVIDKEHRRVGVGSKLVEEVENAYNGKGYEKITLTTFGFQAPEFYRKLGYAIEFVREDREPKLSKYFLAKHI